MWQYLSKVRPLITTIQLSSTNATAIQFEGQGRSFSSVTASPKLQWHGCFSAEMLDRTRPQEYLKQNKKIK